MNRFLTWLVRPVAPSIFARRGRPGGASQVVVCAGDSITHGLISANYVTLLQSELKDQSYTFVNAGVSGDLAWNLGQRLDEVIDCRPDVVTVLIGTNDAAAQIDASWSDGYVKAQHLPQRPTLEWYREQLTSIVHRLHAQTPATVLLLTIPPLGEDLDSRYNDITEHVNNIIRDVGSAADVSVLPLHDRLAESLAAHGVRPRFDGTKRLMGRAVLQKAILRRSYDAIARGIGRELLIDDIHLNDRAAQNVADLIEEELRRGRSA